MVIQWPEGDIAYGRGKKSRGRAVCKFHRRRVVVDFIYQEEQAEVSEVDWNACWMRDIPFTSPGVGKIACRIPTTICLHSSDVTT